MILYKEDWPEARQRWLAFWECEVLDRVCIAVTAPRQDTASSASAELLEDMHAQRLYEMMEVPEPPSNEALWTDVEFIVEYNNALFGNTFWGGEAAPVYSNYVGFPAFGNPRVTFARDTVWAHPWLPNCSTELYQFDPNNRWWRRMCEIQEAVLEDSRGKYFVGMPGGIIQPTDTLASYLRGIAETCIDMIDRPDEVHTMLSHLTHVLQWMYEQIYPPLIEQDSGVHFGTTEWGPGWTIPLQCDFSIMISPEHFREFVMPELVHFADWSERSKYHLDGEGALRHLPAILEIEKVGYVQWVSGAGAPEGLHWQDVWEAVRASGRAMQIGVSYDRVEETVKAWGPKGLFITTSAPTEEAARDLLRHAERWSCQHPWDIR